MGEPEGTATRLDLILNQSPFSRQSIEDLDRIEQAVRSALPADASQDAQLYFVGATASVRDLANVMQKDRTRIEVLVLASVFLILIVLLRRFTIPLYLLLSVLFSYYTTLGVSFIVFYLLDPHGFKGIDWKIAIFLFAILIAVGEDYNIFLMTRIDEEKRRHGPVRDHTSPGSNRPDHIQLRRHHGRHLRLAHGRFADGNEAARLRVGVRHPAGYIRRPAHSGARFSDFVEKRPDSVARMGGQTPFRPDGHAGGRWRGL